jgi:hypothetical protein
MLPQWGFVIYLSGVFTFERLNYLSGDIGTSGITFERHVTFERCFTSVGLLGSYWIAFERHSPLKGVFTFVRC